MTVLHVNATDKHISSRRRSASAVPGRRAVYYIPRRQVQDWTRGLENHTGRRRSVIAEKRIGLPAFSAESLLRGVLAAVLILLVIILLADLAAVHAGGSRIGRLSAGISSLEESNSLLRQEISRTGGGALARLQADEEPERVVVLSPAPEP